MLIQARSRQALAARNSAQARPKHAFNCTRAPMRLAAVQDSVETAAGELSRRELCLSAGAAMAAVVQQLLQAQDAEAITSNPFEYKKELARKRRKIPLEDFKDGPEGIKYYDVVSGGGQEAKLGDRVAVHLDVKWRNITFATTRQGAGVTGGTPLGFDVGQPAGSAGSTMAGVDVGVRGMRVGGQRRVLVPPELGYGQKGYGEIPPGATLQVDIELLSIKTSPLGYRTKLVEG